MTISTDLSGLITFTLTDTTSFIKVVATVRKVTGLSLTDAKAFSELLWDSEAGQLSFVA